MTEWKTGLAVDSSMGDFLFPKYRENGLDSYFIYWKTRDKMERILKEGDKYGLFCSSIHAPWGGSAIIWQDTPEGDKEEAVLEGCVDDCAFFGIPILVVHPFMGFLSKEPGGLKKYEPTEIGLRRYCRLAAYAEEKKVTLAFENVEGEEYLDYLMEGLKQYRSVGFCLDTGHQLCYNRGRDLLKDYGDRLCYLHLNSNMGVTAPDGFLTHYDDAHMLPYDGLADMEKLAKDLIANHYQGILSLELIKDNRPNRTCNDIYKDLSIEEYFALAAKRVNQLKNRLIELEQQ